MPTEKTKAQIDDDILETVYPNDNAEVTAGTVQPLLRNINESMVNRTDDADRLVVKNGKVFTNADLVDGEYEYEHNAGTPYPIIAIWGPDGRLRYGVSWRPKDGTSTIIAVIEFGGAIAVGNWTIKHIA